MTNETFEPMGLVELTKQLADTAQAQVDSGRKKVDDLEERMHSALDAKRDVASDYANQLDTAVKRNESLWKDGYTIGFENGERKGYDEGYKAASEKRDRELLESHGIDVEPLFANVQKIIADHETGSTTSHEQDIDEDEPDQYPPETEKWGGTK